jgi:hypothetical protein
MESDRPRYQGGRIGDPDTFRLHEPDMSDEEYEAYRTAWYEEFPCRCKGACRCQGPPVPRPRRARLLVELPEEPPELTPDAARALLRVLLKAADRQKREADGAT